MVEDCCSFIIEEKMYEPTITPTDGGIFSTSPQTVAIYPDVGTPGPYTIYYTTDGSDPATSPTRNVYTVPFPITGTTTVWAVCDYNGGGSNRVDSFIVYAAPIITPVDGSTFSGSSQSVVLAPPDNAGFVLGVNYTIDYTVDGSDPSGTHLDYSVPFDITGTTTVRAIAHWVDGSYNVYTTDENSATITKTAAPVTTYLIDPLILRYGATYESLIDDTTEVPLADIYEKAMIAGLRWKAEEDMNDDSANTTYWFNRWKYEMSLLQNDLMNTIQPRQYGASAADIQRQLTTPRSRYK
jgi:hypothetical protein